MIFFFYHAELNQQTGPLPERHDRPALTKNLVNIIQCHALAEKYDAESFAAALTNAFNESPVKFEVSMDGHMIETLVHAHYPFCTGILCTMSEAIVTLFINRIDFWGQSEIKPLVMQYGNFAAELLILGIRKGRLPYPGQKRYQDKW